MTSTRTARRRRLPTARATRPLVVLAALAVLASGCSRGPDPLDIGLKRVALDLAFKDPEKADPVQERRIVRTIIGEEYYEDIVYEEPAEPRRRIIVIPPRVPDFVCETAPEDATPAVPAFHVVKGEPKPGVYERHNTGTYRVDLATLGGNIPYPRESTVTITNVKPVYFPPVAHEGDVPGAQSAPDAVQSQEAVFPKQIEFEITKTGHRRGVTITDTFRYTNSITVASGVPPDHLYLVKRVTRSGNEETVFRPTPPLRYIELNQVEGPDSDVNHAAIDRENNISMAVQSTIERREWVDVCGEVVDTYRVRISETMVDLDTGAVSGNVPRADPEGGTVEAQPNYWNIQFNNGLLLVREDVNTVLNTTTPGPGGTRIPVTVTFDYTSTLNSLEPEPLESLEEG